MQTSLFLLKLLLKHTQWPSDCQQASSVFSVSSTLRKTPHVMSKFASYDARHLIEPARLLLDDDERTLPPEAYAPEGSNGACCTIGAASHTLRLSSLPLSSIRTPGATGHSSRLLQEIVACWQELTRAFRLVISPIFWRVCIR